MRRLISLALCATLAVGTPAMVFAQDAAEEQTDEYKATVAEATKAYEDGEYDKAITLFKQAYALKNVSNILYNIGRIYEDAGDIDGAIEYYDKFVVAPNVEKNARKDALERLQTLREVKQIQDGEGTQVAENTQTTKPDPEPEPQPEPEPAPSAGKTAGWVFLGAGVASLAGAGVFALLTQSQYSNFEGATSLDERRTAAASGATYAVVADSLLAVGVVSGIVGAVLLLSSGGSEKASASNFQIAPTFSESGAGVGLGWNF